MATSESFKDLLTCTICLETFKEPKNLPCLHTFCKRCINTYILSSVKDGEEGEFKCPVCRRPVPSVVCKGEAETWAEQLPDNCFIMSMLDKQAIKEAEKLCDGCQLEEALKKAISWCTVCEEAYCESCESCHKTFKMTRNHKIISLKDVNAEFNDSCFYEHVACSEHTDRTVDVYCKDHSKACCTLCATLNHRKCDEVVTIDNVVYGVKKSTKALELSTKLKETSEKLRSVLTSCEDTVAKFKTDSDNVMTEIGKVSDGIVQHVKRIEQTLRDEMSTTTKQVTVQLEDKVTELSSIKSTMDNWKNIFDACLSQGSEIQCLIKMEEILEKKATFDYELKKVTRHVKDISVSFKPSDVISNLSSIGRIHLKGSLPASLRGVKTFDFLAGKVKVLFTIEVDVNKKGFRFISGIFWGDDMIITDQENNRVIYFNDKGQEEDSLKIDGQPTDITKVDDKTVAVAASNTNDIYLIQCEPLVLKRKLTIGAQAWGICYVEDEYIVCSSGTISWINSETGAKIKDRSTGTGTRFITCDGKNDYLYMNTTSSVKYESSSGNGFTYTKPTQDYSYSYDKDCEGNIYVSGFNSKTIHQLSSDGKLIRIIPLSDFTSISASPWVIRFQEESNRFLLSLYTSGKVLICEIDSES